VRSGQQREHPLDRLLGEEPVHELVTELARVRAARAREDRRLASLFPGRCLCE
jgi:hypothetical protein